MLLVCADISRQTTRWTILLLLFDHISMRFGFRYLAGDFHGLGRGIIKHDRLQGFAGKVVIGLQHLGGLYLLLRLGWIELSKRLRSLDKLLHLVSLIARLRQLYLLDSCRLLLIYFTHFG